MLRHELDSILFRCRDTREAEIHNGDILLNLSNNAVMRLYFKIHALGGDEILLMTQTNS